MDISRKSYFNTFSMNKYFDLDYIWGIATAVGGVIAAHLAPVGPFIAIVLCLVIVDLITGIRAAVKRGEMIRSIGLRRSIEKLVLYFFAILLAEGMRNVFMPAIPITYVVALAIASTEFKSNIENIEEVTGVTIWKYISNKLKIK